MCSWRWLGTFCSLVGKSTELNIRADLIFVDDNWYKSYLLIPWTIPITWKQGYLSLKTTKVQPYYLPIPLLKNNPTTYLFLQTFQSLDNRTTLLHLKSNKFQSWLTKKGSRSATGWKTMGCRWCKIVSHQLQQQSWLKTNISQLKF